MITLDDITKLFSLQLNGNWCIEIEFLVAGHAKYHSCWMGKTHDGKNVSYWYGLVPDDSEAYDYDHMQDFFTAPVFDGKSLEEIGHKVEIVSIDGCDPEERMQSYFQYSSIF